MEALLRELWQLREIQELAQLMESGRRPGTGDGPESGTPGHDGGSAAAEVRAAPADALRRRGGGPAAGGGPAVPHRPGACPADGPGSSTGGSWRR